MGGQSIRDGPNMQWWIALSEIVRNFGLVAGGALGIYLAWKRVSAANRQAEVQIRQADAQIRQAALSRQDHVAELFNRAAGQLTDAKFEVRLAAILTMRQICREFPDLADPVFKLLATYLKQTQVNYGENELPADVREIMDMLLPPMEEHR